MLNVNLLQRCDQPMKNNSSKFSVLPAHTILPIFSIIILLSLTSCHDKVDYSKYTLENNPSAQALEASLDTMTLAYQPVTISGKINGYKHGSSAAELEVLINDAIKSDQVFYYNQIHEDGTFEVKIPLAHPQDVMIKYQRVFSIFAAPGDSIYFEFDGRTRSRPRIYSSITFGGDHAETNTQLARYWHKYYHKRDLKELRRAQQQLDFEAFEVYMTKLYDEQQRLRASILDELEANDTTLLYTQLDIDLDVHKRYAEYFMRERRSIEHVEKIVQVLESMPTWRTSSLINTKIKHLANDVHFLVPVTTEQVVDDHFEHAILAHAADKMDQPFLTELVYNELVSQAFARYNDLGDHLSIVAPHIQTPLIAEQLNRKLEKVLQHNRDPEISNKIVLDDIKSVDKDHIIQDLIEEHSDKVLYIDFWGTYCAPCISEMMVSNDMHDHYADQSIAFIYLCIDGEKRSAKWDNIVNGRGLKGYHVQLSDEQSNNLMKGIGFTGVPFYMIIDKEGALIEKGTHLRPSSGKSTMIINNLIGV